MKNKSRFNIYICAVNYTIKLQRIVQDLKTIKLLHLKLRTTYDHKHKQLLKKL